MGTTQTLAPDNDTTTFGSWTLTSGSSAWPLLSDSNDASYLANKNPPETDGVEFGTYTLASDERVAGVKLRVRSAFVNAGTAASYEARLGHADSQALHRLSKQAAGNISIGWHETGWLATDADGREWTQARVDQARVSFFSSGSADRVRLYKVELQLDVNTRPTVSTVTVDGEDSTSRPTVSWVYADDDTDPPVAYRVKVFPSSAYTAAGFDPDTNDDFVWSSGDVSSSALSAQIGVDLQSGVTYRAYVWAAQSFPVGSRWWSTPAYVQFALAFTTPAPPLVTRTVDESLGRVSLDVTQRVNWLTADDASAETTGTAWIGNGTNCTVSRSTARAFHGTASMRMVANATTSAGMSVVTDVLGGNGWDDVRPGQTYTALAYFFANNDASWSDVRVSILWCDAAENVLSTTNGLEFAATDDRWVPATVTGVAPAGAVKWAVRVAVTNGVISGADTVDFDAVAFFPGTLTPNLLTDAQSELDAGVSTWAAGTNCTLTHETSTRLNGAGALRITSSAAGDCEALHTGTPSQGIPVAPGEVLTWRVAVQPLDAARTVEVGLAFYDDAGTRLSTTVQSVATALSDWAGAYEDTDAPVGASRAVLVVSPQSCAAAGERFVVDAAHVQRGEKTVALGWGPGAGDADAGDVLLQVDYQDTRGRNLLPEALSDCTTAAYPLVLPRNLSDTVEVTGLDMVTGVTSLRWTLSSASTHLDLGCPHDYTDVSLAPLAAPGQTMLASLSVRTVTGTLAVRLDADALDGDGRVVASTQGAQVTAGTAWLRITSGLLVCPDTAVYVRLTVRNAAGASSGQLLVDAAQLEVTGRPDPSGWVAGSGDRSVATWSTVRGTGALDPTLTVDQRFWVHDDEAPYGSGVRVYRLRTVQQVGTVTAAGPYTQVSAWVQPPTTVFWWLKNPLRPQDNTPVIVRDNVRENVDEAVTVVHPLGRTLPVALSDTISGTNGSVTIHVEGKAEFDRVERLLRAQNPLLLQSPGGVDRYIRVTRRSWDRTGSRNLPRRDVAVDFTEVGAP